MKALIATAMLLLAAGCSSGEPVPTNDALSPAAAQTESNDRVTRSEEHGQIRFEPSKTSPVLSSDSVRETVKAEFPGALERGRGPVEVRFGRYTGGESKIGDDGSRAPLHTDVPAWLVVVQDVEAVGSSAPGTEPAGPTLQDAYYVVSDAEKSLLIAALLPSRD